LESFAAEKGNNNIAVAPATVLVDKGSELPKEIPKAITLTVSIPQTISVDNSTTSTSNNLDQWPEVIQVSTILYMYMRSM
jgi:hypothetical protein